MFPLVALHYVSYELRIILLLIGAEVTDQKELNMLSSPIGTPTRQTDSKNWNRVFTDTSTVIVTV